jgi:pyridoxamine 5'-phosphate oxidase
MNPDDTFGSDVAIDEAVEDPLALLRQWLARCDGAATPLMTLSTVDDDGYPDSRHLLLSRCDTDGRISFHTDSRSRKAAELATSPRASVAVVWPRLARQLVVTGDVVIDDEAGQEAAYAQRSRYLQLLAWLNDKATAEVPVAERRAGWAAFDAAHPLLRPPPTWVGYLLAPRRIIFWRGDPAAASNRLLCERTAAGWTVERRPG